MNIQEKRKAFEKLLAGAPEVMSPLRCPSGLHTEETRYTLCSGQASFRPYSTEARILSAKRSWSNI